MTVTATATDADGSNTSASQSGAQRGWAVSTTRATAGMRCSGSGDWQRCGHTASRGGATGDGDPADLYLGRHYRLKVHPNEIEEAKLRGGWVPRAPAYSLISVSGSARACGRPSRPPHVRVALVSWFRRHAAERLPEGVEAWRAKAGVAMPRVVIADQQKRCGSCDCSGTVRLNWRIIQAPMRLVDYVVVHELVHLPHRGHRRDYWRALRRVMPDYERRREDLRQGGAGLAW